MDTPNRPNNNRNRVRPGAAPGKAGANASPANRNRGARSGVSSDRVGAGFETASPKGEAGARDKRYGARPASRNDAFAHEKPQASIPRNEPDEDLLPLLIFGRNPVREAIKSGRAIDRIWTQESPDGSLREIIAMARDRSLVMQTVSKRKLDEMCQPFGHGTRTGHHQGIVAQVPGCDYVEVADILRMAQEKGEAPFLLVLDGITDPHNLGAMLRSAACFGVHGVVLPKRRAVGVTAAVMRASAGAAAVVPVARVTNLTETLRALKSAGLWIAGADTQGEDASKRPMSGPLALVIGAEENGLSHLVQTTCDWLVGIPISGPIGSLNASVAAGVLMAEKRRQDGMGRG